MDTAWQPAAAALIGCRPDATRWIELRGGTFGGTWRLESDANRYFIKTQTVSRLRVLEAEADGLRELVRAGLPFAGFVVNRVLPPSLLGTPPFPDVERAAPADVQLGRKLAELQQRFATLVRAERAEIDRLRAAAPDALVVEVPLATDEPSSLSRLVTLSSTLI